MTFRFKLGLWWAALGGLIAGAAACEASLESKCVGGDRTCDLHELGPAASTGAGCNLEACDTTVDSMRTGEYPCSVQPIIDICLRCHTGPEPRPNGAPFPLDTYPDSQKLYAVPPSAIWSRMYGVAVDCDPTMCFMPLQVAVNPPPRLTAAQQAALGDWICACAPPREAGETCN